MDTWEGVKILSSDGKETGIATEHFESCRMEGCNGLRIRTVWKDGKVTKPCSRGLKYVKKNTYRIM